MLHCGFAKRLRRERENSSTPLCTAATTSVSDKRFLAVKFQCLLSVALPRAKSISCFHYVRDQSILHREPWRHDESWLFWLSWQSV